MPLLGLSLWFFIGFPFANHNESLSWVWQFDKYSFLDVFVNRIQPDTTYRPLALATAWLSYRLSGNLGPIQIFNYLVLSISWIIVYFSIKEKRVFTFIFLILGGIFFTCYIYLFHLHGVCYSFLPMVVAVMFMLGSRLLDLPKLAVMALAVIVLALYHPYSMPLFIAYTTGLIIEKYKDLSRTKFIGAVIIIGIAFIFIKLLASAKVGIPFADSVKGLFVSYKMVEINKISSMFSLLLVIITVFSIQLPVFARLLSIFLCLCVSVVLLVKFSVPVLMVWVVVCMIKMLVMRKWSIFLLIAGAGLFPLITGLGSPTYTFLALMVCGIAASINNEQLDDKLKVIINPKIGFVIAISVITIILVLNNGIRIPVISKLANPILSEKEKTHQFESILSWFLNSQYKDYRLVFIREAGSPSKSSNALNGRQLRPPTQQQWVDAYINAKRGSVNTENKLFVCFGNEKVDGAKEVFAIPGKFNGCARVFLPS